MSKFLFQRAWHKFEYAQVEADSFEDAIAKIPSISQDAWDDENHGLEPDEHACCCYSDNECQVLNDDEAMPLFGGVEKWFGHVDGGDNEV